MEASSANLRAVIDPPRRLAVLCRRRASFVVAYELPRRPRRNSPAEGLRPQVKRVNIYVLSEVRSTTDFRRGAFLLALRPFARLRSRAARGRRGPRGGRRRGDGRQADAEARADSSRREALILERRPRADLLRAQHRVRLAGAARRPPHGLPCGRRVVALLHALRR